MLARCALECVIAVDFMIIGFLYMFNQRTIRYAPVLYSNTQDKLPDLFLKPDGFSYTGMAHVLRLHMLVRFLQQEMLYQPVLSGIFSALAQLRLFIKMQYSPLI